MDDIKQIISNCNAEIGADERYNTPEQVQLVRKLAESIQALTLREEKLVECLFVYQDVVLEVLSLNEHPDKAELFGEIAIRLLKNQKVAAELLAELGITE